MARYSRSASPESVAYDDIREQRIEEGWAVYKHADDEVEDDPALAGDLIAVVETETLADVIVESLNAKSR